MEAGNLRGGGLETTAGAGQGGNGAGPADRARLALPMAGNLLPAGPKPEHPGEHVEFPRKREAGNEDRFLHGSEVDLKAVPRDDH